MPCIRLLCSVIIVMLVFFAGCGKQDKQKTFKKSAEMPTLDKKSANDTTDIFKEFYSDDTAGQGSSSKVSKNKSSKSQTFSPAASSSAPSASSSSSEEFLPNGRYVVQVGCVVSKSFANKMVSKLKSMNYPAYTATVQNPTPNLSGTYYRVRIGGFAGFAAAKAFGEKSLVTNGYQYWVDKKSNDNVGMEGNGLGSSAPSGSYEKVPSFSTPVSNSTGNETYTPASTPEANNSAPEPAPAAAPAASAAPASSSSASTAPAETAPAIKPETKAATQPSQVPASATESAKNNGNAADAAKASGSSDLESDSSGSGNW